MIFVAILTGVNYDREAEATRIQERLDRVVLGSASVYQRFWSDRSSARELAILLDRSWHAALLLQSCRTTLAKVYQAMFPLHDQPQGLPALLERFKDGRAIRKMLRSEVVHGANIAFAYIRLHWSYFNFAGATEGLPLSDHYTSTFGWARKVVSLAQQQMDGAAVPLALKDEP